MKSLADIALSSSDRAAIEKAAERLRAQFAIQQIILFGSKARGEDDAESDIDLLIITSTLLSMADANRITQLLYEIQLEHEVIFSPVIVERREWFDGVYRVLPIRSEIERDGVAA